MFHAYVGKRGISLMFIVLVIFFFQESLMARSLISNRSGTIKITRPDGSVLTVEKDEALPAIPSGSAIEVLDGSIEVTPAKGFIQLIVGDSAATVNAGDKVRASIDLKTGMADFAVGAGKISIVTGNTTTTVKTGQQAQIDLVKRIGIVEVRSIKGAIETVTMGVETSVLQGAAAKISVDAKTRNVRVESVEGDVIVISIDGKEIMLAKAESTDTEGSVEGEVQTFAEEIAEPFVPAEEPAEPEIPEASPHRP